MKKILFTMIALLTIAAEANAMSYEQARQEALFLTDKMAYELNLSDAQYEAAYEINLDYLMGVTSQYDVFGPYWERRNLDLSYILFSWQWEAFRAASYFYRPLFWDAGYWHFGIYARYPHRDYFYFGRPHFFATYRGGHSWRMNGGRSYYEGRHDFYRPGHVTRDHHFGMRNGWDRGDYRDNRGGRHSSTHVTGEPRRGGEGRGGYRIGGEGSRGGAQGGGFGSRRGGNGGPDNRGNSDRYDNRGRNPDNRGGNFDNRGGGSNDNRGGGATNNGNWRDSRNGSGSGSYGSGNRSNDNPRGNSGSYGGGGSRNGGGSFGGGSRGGSSTRGGGSGSYSGGGSRSGGSGTNSGGGPRGGSSTRGGGGGSSNSHGSFGGSRR